MKRNFCTFFDKNYLARGLALYYSLIEHCPDFVLWIICIDDDTFDLLQRLKLDKIKPLRASEVEDKGMLTIKATRTQIEYSWLFGSQAPLYLLKKYNLDMITYLDADLFFYSSVEDIYKEFGDKSIMIIPHRYSSKYLFREKTSGIYNVGMLIFKNDNNAIECLSWWKDQCLEWCYDRYEDGKMGDQIYLNDWPTRFNNVHVLKHLGANVSSWNIDSLEIGDNKTGIIIRDKVSKSSFPLIFYHFHGYRIYMTDNGKVHVYPITIYNRKIYKIYLKAIQKAYDQIRLLEPSWKYGCARKLDFFRRIKQYIVILISRK
jgi:hypothetical protein